MTQKRTAVTGFILKYLQKWVFLLLTLPPIKILTHPNNPPNGVCNGHILKTNSQLVYKLPEAYKKIRPRLKFLEAFLVPTASPISQK